MKEFERQFGREPIFYRISSNTEWIDWSERRKGWKAALEHFNKLFLESMHPQDVIFAMQEELEGE